MISIIFYKHRTIPIGRDLTARPHSSAYIHSDSYIDNAMWPSQFYAIEETNPFATVFPRPVCMHKKPVANSQRHERRTELINGTHIFNF